MVTDYKKTAISFGARQDSFKYLMLPVIIFKQEIGSINKFIWHPSFDLQAIKVYFGELRKYEMYQKHCKAEQ